MKNFEIVRKPCSGSQRKDERTEMEFIAQDREKAMETFLTFGIELLPHLENDFFESGFSDGNYQYYLVEIGKTCECPGCENVGVRHSTNPNWSGYLFCEQCAEEYDSRQ